LNTNLESDLQNQNFHSAPHLSGIPQAPFFVATNIIDELDDRSVG